MKLRNTNTNEITCTFNHAEANFLLSISRILDGAEPNEYVTIKLDATTGNLIQFSSDLSYLLTHALPHNPT